VESISVFFQFQPIFISLAWNLQTSQIFQKKQKFMTFALWWLCLVIFTINEWNNKSPFHLQQIVLRINDGKNVYCHMQYCN